MASDSEKEKYKLALVATRDVRNLVNNVFENAIKDFSADKTKLKETLLKLERKLRYRFTQPVKPSFAEFSSSKLGALSLCFTVILKKLVFH